MAQSAGGCKKRKRARVSREHITMKRRQTQQRRHKTHGHGYAKRGTKTPTLPNVERQDGYTFDDEYRLFKKTRGRQGLNPNPAFRQDENPAYLASNSVLSTRRVPIGELMERPIGKIHV